jgi:ankyrin repeat protein
MLRLIVPYRGYNRSMIKPRELESDGGRDIWATMTAAERGDTETLRALLQRDPGLSRAEYFYTHPIHFAVRSGRLEAVRMLLDGGADPEWNGHHDGSLIEMAQERGHDAVVQLLAEARERRSRVVPGEEHPIHKAAQADDAARVRELLDADPSLVNRGDRSGGSPLHRAAIGSAWRVIDLLLDRGANIHATHSVARGCGGGWGTNDTQAVDLAIWGSNLCAPSRGDFKTALLLVSRGADHDLTVAAALGDMERVTALLNQDPACLGKARANGRRALTAAVEFRHPQAARLLLERGADPKWPESGAPRGAALRLAAGMNDPAMVELLLAHGADPNSGIDSGGSATWAASPSLRPLLIAHGGKLDSYDSVWLNDDEEVVRRAKADPASAECGCGGVFTAAVTNGKRDLLLRLLEAGIRVPPTVTACRSYLMENLEMFQVLLAHGMNPDLPNWQGQTFLHDLCSGGRRGQFTKTKERAEILLAAGASLTSREDEYSSTPLGWAARTNMLEMVEFLIARGAPLNLPDDPAWATPLAWATRRGHMEAAEILRRHGAAR